jgi:L-threonylcarbamoyladenylate synthase
LIENFERIPQKGDLQRAVACLQGGGIVAIPTETSYGLAVDPFNERALRSLFLLKRRELHKPILVLVNNVSQLDMIVAAVPVEYKSLMDTFWPGPLTLIFPGRQDLSPLLTGGTGTVGVRISSHPIAAKLCDLWGGPITATSANISGSSPANSAEEIHTIFASHIDCILDGGKSPGGICSTIVGIQNKSLKLMRAGKIEFPSVQQAFKSYDHNDSY